MIKKGNEIKKREEGREGDEEKKEGTRGRDGKKRGKEERNKLQYVQN